MTLPSSANPLSPPQTGIRARSGLIKNWVRKCHRIDDDTVISVTELACRGDGCRDIETVIGILEPRKPIVTFRVHKPISDVEEQDVVDAISILSANR